LQLSCRHGGSACCATTRDGRIVSPTSTTAHCPTALRDLFFLLLVIVIVIAADLAAVTASTAVPRVRT